jgi:Flp pilus assembly protein TadG
MKRASQRKDRGAAVIEMAIVLPIFAILLLGAIDFSRVFFAAIELGNAVTAGAEFGSRTTGNASNTSGISSTVTQDASDLTGVSATSVSYCTCPGSSTQVGCSTVCTGYGPPKMYVSVTGTYTWTSVVSWPAMPDNVPISRTVVMRAR